jgi:predicted AlkP superfamily pyrophosphatase or phosphodiesterase
VTRAAWTLLLSLKGLGTPATVVLVSIDGFRYDYLERYPSPNLHRIIAEGVRAPLVSEFPTKTFPNHYSIVTGLFPEHHGIVDNTMYDPWFDAEFHISDSAAVTDGRWWGGEPLWVTAEKQGQRAAPFLWPGGDPAGPCPGPHWLVADAAAGRRHDPPRAVSWR